MASGSDTSLYGEYVSRQMWRGRGQRSEGGGINALYALCTGSIM